MSLLLSNFGVNVNIRLVVIANTKQLIITLPPHSASQSTQPLADLQDLTLHEYLHAGWHRAHVRGVEGAADAHGLPEAGLADKHEGHGGAEIE